MSDGRRRLHMVGNAHLDPVWLWQWPEGYAEVRATFRSALDRMAEDPEFRFSQGSVAYYAWLEESDPEAFEEVRRRVAEGRWELVGGWWVEPDCNLPGGESFVRQALIGQRWLAERFGRGATVGTNIDPFGHAATLPQILRGSGLDAYVFLRPGPHERALPAVFWWEADDGSQVLAVRVPHEYCAPGGDIGGHVDKVVAQLPADWTDGLCLYGVGNHGGGPTRANLASIRRLRETDQVPDLPFSTLGRFVATQRERDDLPVIRGELQHHAVGCYSAHSGIKHWVRQTEALLLAAERFAAAGASVGGPAYPREDLGRAWRSLLFNEFHDILAGTSVEPAYDDARDELGEARAIASRTLHAGVQAVTRRVAIPLEEGSTPIVVANPHPWSVRAAVEVEVFRLTDGFALVDDGGHPVEVQATRSLASTLGGRQRIVFVADLPPLGYRLYRLRPSGGHGRPFLAWTDEAAARPVSSAEPIVLENDHLRLEVDAVDGSFTRLVHRSSGAAVLDASVLAAPRAVVYADESDTWSHRVLAYRSVVGAFRTRRILWLERGPVRSILRIESAFNASLLVEDVIVASGLPAVEVRATLDWRERGHLLKLRFPVAVAAALAVHEIPFGSIARPADGTEYPVQGWVDVSGTAATGGVSGLALLNDGKPGADVLATEIGMTVVRSPGYAHHEPAPLPADERAPWMDQGVQRFGYALVPHAGPAPVADLTRAAVALALAPVSVLETFHDGPLPRTGGFLAAEPASVVITAAKLAEDGGDDLIVRCRETAGEAVEATLLVGLGRRRVPLTLGPHAIRTLRIPRDPAAPVVRVNLVEWPAEEGSVAEPGQPSSTSSSGTSQWASRSSKRRCSSARKRSRSG